MLNDLQVFSHLLNSLPMKKPFPRILALVLWLQKADVDARELLAKKADTSVAYLYQIAGGHRRASAELAIALEAASKKVLARYGALRALKRERIAPHVRWRNYQKR